MGGIGIMYDYDFQGKGIPIAHIDGGFFLDGYLVRDQEVVCEKYFGLGGELE